MKYMEINDLNKDQVALAESKGWCIYTQVEDACGLIYKKGLAWANRIGYVIFSESVDAEAIDGSAIGDWIFICLYCINANQTITKTITKDLSQINNRPSGRKGLPYFIKNMFLFRALF